MSNPVIIELVLTDTFSPGAGPGISVQLACGPASERDFRLVDLGLDETTVEALVRRSSDDDFAREVGERLLTALQRKEEVRRALAGAQCPISLMLAGQNGTRLPWETLFDSARNGFLELGGTTPTSRAMPDYQAGSSPALLDRPRILAVLSAPRPQVPGTYDWSYTELRQLINAIGLAGVEVDLQVLSSESSVLQEAQQAGLRATKIIDAESIIYEIEAFDPHFLHFFCHGIDAPSPHLRLYKPADGHTKRPQIKIDADMLASHIGCTCLIVLNSCSGASSRRGTESMAQLLVSKRFPVVIGMREPIEWHDATGFTFAFYRHMLRTLRPPGTRIDLRLLATLVAPRRELLSRFDEPPSAAAELHREWTLPVIYTRPGSVVVPVMAADLDKPPEQQAWREGRHLAINSVRKQLHPDTPSEADEILARLANELTVQEAEDEGVGDDVFPEMKRMQAQAFHVSSQGEAAQQQIRMQGEAAQQQIRMQGMSG
jgi:hypothetical protein